MTTRIAGEPLNQLARTRRKRGAPYLDRYSREKRSAVKAANASPEVAVRRLVHELGYRFRLHRLDLPGTPDLVVPRHRAVVFVNGCFWHQHDCRRGRRQPSSNQAYWSPKLARNVERDATARSRLAQMGWRVLTIWEWQVAAPELSDRIERFLRTG